MFEQALAIEYGHSNRPWTTLLGMAGQALAVAGICVLPMAAPNALPRPETLVHLFLPVAPFGPASPAGPAVPQRPMRRDLQVREGVLRAPSASAIPPRALTIEEPPLAGGEAGVHGTGVPGGIPGGVENGIPGGLPLASASAVPPPVPAARPAEKPRDPPAAAAPQRIRQGGEVQAAMLIRQVVPEYPAIARQARVAGTVELLAVVGTDGRIRQLTLVRGHALLVGAAIAAVQQWIYRPTCLNGDPVEVIAPISVHFRLN